jgi:tetratricopeptide (TPR) repeat protein
VLLVRAKKDLGQYKQALESGNELLALANRTGVLYARAQAEEAVGSIEVALERYPDALTHFQNARLLADSDTLRAYEVSYCADTLWRLGRYTESEALLKIASGTPALLSIVGESRVESLLSQQKYKPALALAQQIIAKDPEMVAERKRDLELDEAVAEAHLGMKKQAQAGLSAIAAPDQPGGNPTDAARQKLAAAEVYLWMGMNQQAREAALATQDTFASNGQRDSELRSAFLAAAAAKSLKDDDNYRSLSKKVLDILQQLQQDWGLQSYRKYISRPDMHLLTQGAQIKAN